MTRRKLNQLRPCSDEGTFKNIFVPYLLFCSFCVRFVRLRCADVSLRRGRRRRGGGDVSGTFEVGRNNFAPAWHLQRNGFWLTSARTICALRPTPPPPPPPPNHPLVCSLPLLQTAGCCVRRCWQGKHEGGSRPPHHRIYLQEVIYCNRSWLNNRKASPFEWLPQIDERNILRRRELVNYINNNDDVVHSKCEWSSCVVLSIAWQTAQHCCLLEKVVYFFSLPCFPRLQMYLMYLIHFQYISKQLKWQTVACFLIMYNNSSQKRPNMICCGIKIRNG